MSSGGAAQPVVPAWTATAFPIYASYDGRLHAWWLDKTAPGLLCVQRR